MKAAVIVPMFLRDLSVLEKREIVLEPTWKKSIGGKDNAYNDAVYS